MFRIADGREHFYQWDLDRQIIVGDASITEVHFCNRTDDCSLVVEVKDGLANVPNVLLQNGFDIRVFGYDGKATFYEKKFKVCARTRPADYAYDETEVVTVQTMIDRANQTLEVTNEALANTEEALSNIEIAMSDATEALERANTANDRAETAITDVERFANEAKESAEQAQAAVVNYYTKEEHATNYGDAKEVFYFDFQSYNYTSTFVDVPEDYKPVFTRLAQGEQLTIYIKDYYAYAVADIQVLSDTVITFRTHYTDAMSNNTTITEYTASGLFDTWAIKCKSRTVNDFATKNYVDESIAGTTYILKTQDYNTPVTDANTIKFLEHCWAGELYPASINGYAIYRFKKEPLDQTNQLALYYQVLKNYRVLYEYQVTYRRTAEGSWYYFTHAEYQRNIFVRATSELENDSGFVTKTTVDSAIAAATKDNATKTELNNLSTELREELDTSLEGLDAVYATKSEIPSLEGYATEKYVDDAIANIDIPEPTGSGVKVLIIRERKADYSEEEMTALYAFAQEQHTQYTTIPSGYVFYLHTDSRTNAIPYKVYAEKTWMRAWFYSSDGAFSITINFSTDGKISSTYRAADGGNTEDPNAWHYCTSDGSYYELYDAKEVYILAQDDSNNSKQIFSHVVFDNSVLGYNTYVNYAFTTPEGSDYNTPYWSYDGSSMSFSFQVTVKTIAYKK